MQPCPKCGYVAPNIGLYNKHKAQCGKNGSSAEVEESKIKEAVSTSSALVHPKELLKMARITDAMLRAGHIMYITVGVMVPPDLSEDNYRIDTCFRRA